MIRRLTEFDHSYGECSSDRWRIDKEKNYGTGEGGAEEYEECHFPCCCAGYKGDIQGRSHWKKDWTSSSCQTRGKHAQ